MQPAHAMKLIELLDRLRVARAIFQSEKLELSLFGSDEAEAAYRDFSKGHRLLPFMAAKAFGAALFRLPETDDEYLRGKSFEFARRQRRKAMKAGFQFRHFEAGEHEQSILEINRSAPQRQGRAIPSAYTDEREVARFCRDRSKLFGVFDASGKLVAYADAPVLGDIFLLSRILGHTDHQESGTMYLLVTEITSEMILRKHERGYPTWAMYDMFLGASSGLRFFKNRLGFKPYRVRWHFRERDV